jgi:hypothetical protein
MREKPSENAEGAVFPSAMARICALQAQLRTGQQTQKEPVETTLKYYVQSEFGIFSQYYAKLAKGTKNPVGEPIVRNGS